MKWKKNIAKVLSVILLLTSSFIRISAAEPPVVSYDGNTKQFTIENTVGNDLFPEFKNMMPGDSKTQIIGVRAENIQAPVTFYLQAMENLEVFEHVILTVSFDGQVISEGSLGNPEGLKENREIVTFEEDGYKELTVTLTVSEEAGNELADAITSLQWIFTTEDFDVSDNNAITIRATDLTAYTGGDSINDDSFPVARYSIELPEGVDIEDVEFFIDGETPFSVSETENVIIQELEEKLLYHEDDGSEIVKEDDREAGVYTIDIEEKGRLSAKVNEDYYPVNFQTGILTIRYLTDPDAVIDGSIDIAVPVSEQIPQVYDEIIKGDKAYGVVEEDTVYKTNGTIEIVGLTENDDNGKISLLYDDLLPSDSRQQQLEEKTEKYLQDENISIADRQYVYKYLDLINEYDGNAWVSSSKGVDVYFPYPDGTSYENADQYVFTVLHYKDLHREYGFFGETLREAIENCEIEEMEVEKTEYGLKIHVSESGFSPFAVTWQPIASAGIGVDTGDNINIAVWVGVFALSVIVIVGVLVYYKKKDKKQDKKEE